MDLWVQNKPANAHHVGPQVLGNITIGSGSMIGAGSLVLKPVAPRAMVAGSPAKVVGMVGPCMNGQRSVFILGGSPDEVLADQTVPCFGWAGKGGGSATMC